LDLKVFLGDPCFWDYHFDMQVILEIPDDVASTLPSSDRSPGGLSATVLEYFAVEAYRQTRLSSAQVGRLLGHSSRWETEDFLSSHDAWPGLTAEEAAEDARTLSDFLDR
jgi:hypothetical protein